MNFAYRLKELRTEKGFTQDQLAEKADLSHGCIAMLETGKRTPTGNTLSILADIFECSTDFLLGREDDFGNITVKSESSAPVLSADERELLEHFRAVDERTQQRILARAEVLRQDYEEERKPRKPW